MKLIEKLANESLSFHPEYCRDSNGEDLDGFSTCYERGYEAGFRKAREMANDIHEACGAGAGCCSSLILNIGEQECSPEKN